MASTPLENLTGGGNDTRMGELKILFIPASNGGLSHQIPLYVYGQRLLKESPGIRASFLLPGRDHQTFRQARVPVLDIDYSGSLDELLQKEQQCYHAWQPDIVFDDGNATTFLAKKGFPVAHITMYRAGMYREPGVWPPHYTHSGWKNWIKDHPLLAARAMEATGQRQIEAFTKVTKVVPGIPEIERLPPMWQADPSFFFCGPLLMSDQLPAAREEIFDRFFKAMKAAGKPVVFFTMGLAEEAAPVLIDAVRWMLQNGFAVISTVDPGQISPQEEAFFLHDPFCPMDYLSARVDLMIHHCGSGIYHYPILYQKPAVTIGTNCFDREEIARRLAHEKLSFHLDAAENDPDFLHAFQSALQLFKDHRSDFIDHSRLAHFHQRLMEQLSVHTYTLPIRHALENAGVEH